MSRKQPPPITHDVAPRNAWTGARAHARAAKHAGECPYSRGPWRSFWLREFEEAKQIDFINDEVKP